MIGASGFVGRHVVSALGKAGAEVVATARDVSRLADLPNEAERVALDLAEPAGAFIRLGRPDIIVHLAWEGLPNYGALRHFEVELARQYAFLRQLVIDGAQSLLVTGTCLEYGLRSGELDEGMLADPQSAYALAKNTLHSQLQMLAGEHLFALTWARLFYLYGEGQAPTSLYSLLHQAIARGDQSFNMSAGEQLRDFLPIGEAATLISRLALARRSFGAVNICSGTPRSVRSLVETWLQTADAQLELNLGYYPYPSYEPMAFWGSAKKLLNLTKLADRKSQNREEPL